MPKTSMHEDDLQARGEYQIRPARKVLPVKAEAVAKPMDKASNREFWLHIRAADRTHVGATVHLSAP
jgi:hypothetical protein